MSPSRTPTSVPCVSEEADKRILSEWGSSSFSKALRTLVAWMTRSGQRKALRELAQEGRLLADIGLTREQALAEAAKPFWR